MNRNQLSDLKLQAISQPLLRVPSVFILILALMLTGLATYFSRQSEMAERESRLSDLTSQLQDEISDRMRETYNVLAATRSVFSTSESIDRSKFSSFVNGVGLEMRFPGVQGIGFGENIFHDQLSRHISRVRRSGLRGYTVWPPGPRKSYVVVLHIEPFNERNQRAIGFDILTEGIRRQAVERAQDTGAPSVSRALMLVQERGEDRPQKGFIIFYPIYKRDMPVATVEQRRAAFAGFIFVPVRAGDFFSAIFRDLRVRPFPVGIEVFDGDTPTPESLLYSSMGGVVRAQGDPNSRTFPIFLAGNQWTVTVKMINPTSDGLRLNQAVVVFIGGTIISLFIFLLALVARRYARSMIESENQMRLVADMIPILIARVDRHHRYTFNNRSSSHWHGLSPEELRGRHVGSVEPYLYENVLKPRLDRALQGEEVHFEAAFKHQQLGERLCEVEYIPERRADGQVVGVVVTIADITEQRHFSERLKAERRVSERINEVGLSLRSEMDLEKLTQFIIDVAVDLTSAEIGTLFYQIRDEAPGEIHFATSGVAKDDLKGLSLPNKSEILSQTLVHGKAVRIGNLNGETELKRNVVSRYLAARLKVVSYMAVPVLSRSGEVLGALLFGHSSEKKFDEWAEALATGVAAQAGVALENACLYAEAQAINHIKDEFLATLSHELRTPLNVILGYSELLFDSELTSEQKDYVGIIRRNAESQSQLIADLLDVSAIMSGKLTFHPQRTRPEGVIRAAIESVRFSARSKGVNLSEEVESNLKDIFADPTRLQQIIWNLLSNALKFTSRGGQVTVRAVTEDASLVIEVLDTGVGIEKDFLPYVFDRFRQEDSSRSRRYGGLGLGLSIVRQLVELHGGTIEAESAGKGRGSKFTVRLPLAPTIEIESKKDERPASPRSATG